jgi:hypothetical protein
MWRLYQVEVDGLTYYRQEERVVFHNSYDRDPYMIPSPSFEAFREVIPCLMNQRDVIDEMDSICRIKF